MALVPRAANKTKGDWPTGRSSEAQSASLPPPPSSAQARREDLALISDFDRLYEQFHKQLFNWLFQWLGDYEEAADLMQETFVSAFKAREQFRGDARLQTWLYRIAHNHCKNRFKQRSRQREMEGPSLDAGINTEEGDDAQTRDVADWNFSPSRLLEQKELRSLIEKTVDGLAPEYKVVLILREVEDLSYNEIAEVTGLTLEAVKTRLNRARAMVRQRVEPYIKP